MVGVVGSSPIAPTKFKTASCFAADAVFVGSLVVNVVVCLAALLSGRLAGSSAVKLAVDLADDTAYL
jgi:small-conductance mechanosensitive channel